MYPTGTCTQAVTRNTQECIFSPHHPDPLERSDAFAGYERLNDAMSTGKTSKPREEGSITPSFPDGSITPSVPEVSPAVGQPRPHLTVAAGQKFDNVGQNF